MLTDADDGKQLCVIFIVPDYQTVFQLLRQMHQQGIIGIAQLVNYNISNSNHIFSPFYSLMTLIWQDFMVSSAAR